MRVALVNPGWSFDGSIYFGCREPHLPLELGYAEALLSRDGHATLLVDAALDGLDEAGMRRRVAAFAPDMIVLTTAPTYLFWRCAPPELRVPQRAARSLRDIAPMLVAVGPHGSTTPHATLAKLDVDVVVMGECEEVVAALASEPLDRVPSIAYRRDGFVVVQGAPTAARFVDAPPLRWPDAWMARHRHHHHRFDAHAEMPGAEVEASRGCPYHCSFCAKIDFRDKYRRRNLDLLLQELDGLRAQGIGYVYFVDEIFLPDRRLLEALVGRGLQFGVQTRVDLWKPDMLSLLGRAGCVSIEAGVESLTVEGRALLDKDCRISTDDLTERLLFAKQHVAFVQANLIEAGTDDAREVAAWRERLQQAGVWANEPVPMFPYPGSPDYRKRWGAPDDRAWERALDWYLGQHARFSDIQEARPLRLQQLETVR
ncbi:MAG: putative oxidoreductase With radical domain [Rhodospirillales bacterium]|nr:putative oxidoreductase With radical domain [Rhodospirillales bacterium]